MKIAFRVDASDRMGTGHVMRCLALAEELRVLGSSVEFVSREHPGNLCERISAGGFAVHRLPAPSGRTESDPLAHADWLGETQAADAAQTARFISAADWLVVDHYGLDQRWERELRGVAANILAIDDLADRQHDCDLLLDHNFFPDAGARYAGKLPAGCRPMLGPHYALLRREFSEARATARPRESIERAAIFLGGADHSGATLKALQAAAGLGLKAIIVLVGASNPHRKEIQRLAASVPGATCVDAIERVSHLMLEADVFIGGGGVTSWERACLGIPSIVVAIATNQIAPARALGEAGCALYLGEAASVSSEAIRAALEALRASPALVRHLSARSTELTDGKGAQRVACAIAAPPLQLRRAVAADSATLHEWRNAPANRRHFFDPSEISDAEHASWLECTLKDPNRVLLIGEAAGQARGVLRYDFKETEATVSIYLVPGQYGMGWGTRLLRAGKEWLRGHRPGLHRIRAEVLPTNLASQRTFKEAGFLERYHAYVDEHP